MTPRTLIIRCLRKASVNGVGQSPDPDDLSDALDDLNDMTAQWARRRWLVPSLIDVAFGPSGKVSYSIGPGITNDIITPRPDRIEAGFLRFNPDGSNASDYPLDILDSREDYNRIVLKSQPGTPACVFYDSDYPVGNIYLWPNQGATGQSEVHLTFKSNDISVVWGLDDLINLPPEYNDALLYNLSARLRPSYGLPQDPTLVALAKTSLATIRRENLQIARLGLPSGFPGLGIWGQNATQLLGGSSTLSPGAFRLDISKLDGSDTLS